MSLLAIETSTQMLGVALVDGERLLASYELLANNPHAVELPGAVSRVLAAAHTTLDRVEAIIVGPARKRVEALAATYTAEAEHYDCEAKRYGPNPSESKSWRLNRAEDAREHAAEILATIA